MKSGPRYEAVTDNHTFESHKDTKATKSVIETFVFFVSLWLTLLPHHPVHGINTSFGRVILSGGKLKQISFITRRLGGLRSLNGTLQVMDQSDALRLKAHAHGYTAFEAILGMTGSTECHARNVYCPPSSVATTKREYSRAVENASRSRDGRL